MKKDKIYQLANFYFKNIAKEDLSFAEARYFRDTFKTIVNTAIEIEKDREPILKIEDNNKKEEEHKKLMEEEVDIALPEDLMAQMEKAGIKVSPLALAILE